jgi:spore coat protein U-like protein
MTRFLKASVLTMVMFGAVASTAAAQSANISATANVYQAISVTGARTLDFGNVFPGVNKAIGVIAPTSGKFSATGQASANVNMTFTLPTDLTGPANLPIGSWTGCYNGTDDASSGCTSFVPSASASGAAFGAAGTLYVFVGATVSPASNQAAGSYTGTVTMTLAYF